MTVTTHSAEPSEREYQEFLEDQIHEAIRKRLSHGSNSMLCQASEDEIVLRGECQSYYHKQLAQEIARGIAPSRRISNRLRVRWPKSPR